ncbi:hypothetical protein NECAME_19321 [Necator americanus]|uniref:Bestrophin homolog n=1 Tax=Necator americanus TaxID=51031 RepID=W2SRY4_NECAM|nr:hypothetical protein NECAME_19321 [Necator americanus]ETN71467.1 hypothetical protein NECAME_19321 [Necator americanus]
MTSIQFVLYMGWLKVAEALLNPWGLDDDDFETNMLIDRNLAMGLKIVDDGYGKTPELRKDAFWDDQWVPLYSEESAWEKKYKHHEGSLSQMKLVSPDIGSFRITLGIKDPLTAALRTIRK